MELRDYVEAFRRSALLIVVVTSAFTAIAVTAALGRVEVFTSQADILLTSVSSSNVNEIYTTQQIVQRNVATFAAVATSPQVLAPVAADLDVAPEDLAGSVSSTYADDRPLITVRAEASTPESAFEVASAVSEEAVAVLNAPPPDEGARVVDASIITPASLPTDPDGLPSWLIVAGGFFVGLVIALLLALLRRALDSTLGGASEVEARLGVPVLGSIPYAYSPTRPEAWEAALMTASTVSRGWSGESHSILLASADTGDDVTQLAQGLAAGLQGLGMTTSVVGAASLPKDARARWRRMATLGRGPQPPVGNDDALTRTRGVGEAAASSGNGTSAITVILAPPLADGPDGLLLADWSTENILVLRKGHTTYPSAAEALRLLNAAGVPVQGILLATIG